MGYCQGKRGETATEFARKSSTPYHIASDCVKVLLGLTGLRMRRDSKMQCASNSQFMAGSILRVFGKVKAKQGRLGDANSGKKKLTSSSKPLIVSAILFSR